MKFGGLAPGYLRPAVWRYPARIDFGTASGLVKQLQSPSIPMSLRSPLPDDFPDRSDSPHSLRGRFAEDDDTGHRGGRADGGEEEDDPTEGAGITGDEAQPEGENGVEKDSVEQDGLEKDGAEDDMATIALDQTLGTSAAGGAFNTGRSVTAGELSAMSDAEIMLRVREGDDSGFEYLIQKYHKPMIHFMFRMVHNQAVAEELAQEVFLRVYRSRQSYRAEAKFTTWLYRIATNLGVNHARDTKYERAAQNVYLDQPDPETGTTPDVADLTASVEQELVKDERMKAIRQHVLALPERQRNAVLMHKYQGLDYKQIGEVLKLSESATKSLLFRAYQTLRERLKEFV